MVANAQSSTAPTFPAGLTLTWTANGSAWTATRSNTWNVFDTANRDVYGVGRPLDYVGSSALCQSTPNSWYTDGTTVWVALQNSTLYMRDMEFYSGFLGDALHAYGSCFIQGDISSKVITNGCFFVGGEARDTGAFIPYVNGVQFLNVGQVYNFNSVAAYTRRDAFNYHYYAIPTASQRACLAFEYECVAYESGRYDTTGNNNATTAHEGVNTLRIGCIGYKTQGPVCVDVNGCYSILIDCKMRDSTVSDVFDASRAFYFDNVSAVVPGKAVLINCEGGSPKYSLFGSTGFNMNVRNFVGKKIKDDIALTFLS